MDGSIKELSIKFHDRLKTIVNAKIHCTIDEKEDKLYVVFNRLGLQYDTSISNISSLLDGDEDKFERTLDIIVKRVRQYVDHKFFY